MAARSDLGRETMRKVSLRLLPFLFVLYLLNFLDRSNVALAALQMNRDLQFSASAFGFGAGIFFAGYAIFEVPSNIALARIGARRWIARIMISWGLIATGGVLIAIGFTGAALVPNPVVRVMFLGTVIVGSNAMLAPFWCLPSIILSGGSAAVGIALINSLGNTGGFLGPYLIGFIKDLTGGTRGSFLVLALFGLASAACCLILRQSAFGTSIRARPAADPA